LILKYNLFLIHTIYVVRLIGITCTGVDWNNPAIT